MTSQSEEECAHLVRLLPPTEAALLDWAINLMADVAQLEHLNKMNARNVAMVFAPNMTQVSESYLSLTPYMCLVELRFDCIHVHIFLSFGNGFALNRVC
jgi:hypothetical protein